MNTRKTYRSLLRSANRNLKHFGMKLVLSKEDNTYSLSIETLDGSKKENYASGYFENELDELVNEAKAHAMEHPLSGGKKLDVNRRFHDFRESVINDFFDALMEVGGTLDMSNVSVSLKFDNLVDEFVDEEFRAVEALSLRADSIKKGKVILTAVDCTEEDPETVEWDLGELSADELFNVLAKAETFLLSMKK